MADSGPHVRGHSPTVNLHHIKERLIFLNKHDRNMLFPTNVVENGSSANGGNGKDIIFHGPLIKLGTEIRPSNHWSN